MDRGIGRRGQGGGGILNLGLRVDQGDSAGDEAEAQPQGQALPPHPAMRGQAGDVAETTSTAVPSPSTAGLNTKKKGRMKPAMPCLTAWTAITMGFASAMVAAEKHAVAIGGVIADMHAK